MDWLLISIGIIFLGLVVLVAIKLLWNIRLAKFQRRNGVLPPKKHRFAVSKSLVTLSILLVLSIFTISGGVTMYLSSIPNTFKFDAKEVGGRTYENAKKVESKDEFLKVIGDVNKNQNLYHFGIDYLFRADLDKYSSTPVTIGNLENDGLPTITDTYNQVAGVVEADIAKVSKDGKFLVYGPAYSNKVYRLELNSDGSHQKNFKVKQFTDFYYYEMFLYEDKLILIGATTGTNDQINSDLLYENTFHYYYLKSSAYYILDANTLEVLHETRIEGRITETRLVKNMFYVVSSNHLSQYVENKNSGELPSFQNTYYFKGDANINETTKILSIDLNSDKLLSNEISFFGSNSGFYMGDDKIVLVNFKWRYNSQINKAYNTSSIIVVNYDESGSFTYVGSYEVDGMIENQYHIDVFEDQIRIVTTRGIDNRNALFIFNVDPKTDQLILIGSLTEGIGKPGETVRSVTYQDNIVKIVTFLQTDPLYTIDLTDPTTPIIISAIEEPGFSSVLFVWDELGNTIGIGYMANQLGVVTGIKVSAYKTGDSEPTQTFEFPYNDEHGSRYLKAQALNNPRQHLLLNKDMDIFGFIVFGFKSQGNPKASSKTLIFNVDFNNIKTPLSMHELADEDFDYDIEKMVMINDVLHILSSKGVYSYNFNSKSFDEFLKF